MQLLSFVHTKLQHYGFVIVLGIVTNCLFHTKRFPIVLTAVCLHALESPRGTVLLKIKPPREKIKMVLQHFCVKRQK